MSQSDNDFCETCGLIHLEGEEAQEFNERSAVFLSALMAGQAVGPTAQLGESLDALCDAFGIEVNRVGKAALMQFVQSCMQQVQEGTAREMKSEPPPPPPVPFPLRMQ